MASFIVHNELRKAVRKKQRQRYDRSLWIRAKRDPNTNPVDGLEASRVATEYLKLNT